MLFEYAISGEPKEDSLVCGIDNGESGGITTNLFAIQAKFPPPHQISTSSLIDISSYAGKTNNLFFAILGGTSINCSIQIDGIRFFSSPGLTRIDLDPVSVTPSGAVTMLRFRVRE